MTETQRIDIKCFAGLQVRNPKLDGELILKKLKVIPKSCLTEPLNAKRDSDFSYEGTIDRAVFIRGPGKRKAVSLPPHICGESEPHLSYADAGKCC